MNDQVGKSAPEKFADPRSFVLTITKSLLITNNNMNIKFKYLIVHHKSVLVKCCIGTVKFNSDNMW